MPRACGASPLPSRPEGTDTAKGQGRREKGEGVLTDPAVSRFTRVAIAAAVIGLLVLGAAVAARWWISREPARPLEEAWQATVLTIAGGGVPGSGERHRYGVRFADPFGVAVAADGTLFVSDGAGGHRIYRVSPDGSVATFAGGEAGLADGAGASAQFNTPSAIARDANGNIFVADTGNNAVRVITADGAVSTLADASDGLSGPIGVAIAPDGRVIVADTYNDQIKAIAPGGTVTIVAGSGQPGFEDGAAGAAQFDTPCGVTIDGAGNIYVADTGNGAVRVIRADGLVQTIAPGYSDAPMRPVGIAVDSAGFVFVADQRGTIVELAPSGSQRLLAGGRAGFADGIGEAARFRAPSGVAVASRGRLLVTDRRNGLVRLVSARSQMAMQQPAPPMRPHFDAEAFDRLPLLWPFTPLEGPFEVTGTLGEPRGAEGSERFHAGLDVYSPEGTLVRTVRGGIVDEPLATNDLGSLNESVRIGPLAYIHLRVGRDHREQVLDDGRFVVTRDESARITRMRLKRGASFGTGEVIGTLNGFYHAHLNVGWPGEELNPLRFRLAGFEDTIPPAIARGGIRLLAEDGAWINARDRQRIVATGRVKVVVDAWDQVNGNQARRKLGIYRLGYQLLHADGTAVAGFESPLETIRFERQPQDAAAARIIYASGSGIPVYGSRMTRFLYVVTSTLRNGVAAEGAIDTTTLQPGDYTVRVLAADMAGNEAIVNRDLAITIPAVSR